MAKLIIHRHIRIGFFRFPFVHLTHITSLFLIAFQPVPRSGSTLHYYIGYALASTRISAVSYCQPPAITLPLSPNTAHCPLLFVHDGRRDQANRQAPQAHAQRQDCDNYDSVRCRLTVLSHDNSTITNRHPTLARCLSVARSMKRDTMLHGVMRGCPYRPPRITTGPTHVVTNNPSSACIYTLLPTNKLYILSCFLALLIVAGRSWNLICG